jgi:beta-glucosidase
VSPDPARFPAGFLWGAGTSAHQVEGGNRWNDWWRFEHTAGAVADGDTSGDACRHWERFEEDFALAAADGHGVHRLSLEWSRIEPAEGRRDPAAIAHYHEVLASLARHRLRPIVTLWHFTLPAWIADQGGFENRATLDRFDEHVRFCAREFGGEVDWWCTINEPEVYAFRAYSEGRWPPGKRNESTALVVIGNLLEAHARAAAILRAEDRADADGDGHATRIGFAKHWVVFEPSRPWFPLDVLRTRIEDAVFNQAVARAPATGRVELSIPGARPVRRPVPGLQGSADWMGLNYYTRWKVRMFVPDPHVAAPGATLNDLGWEDYPRGIETAARGLAAASGLPLLVTEHGVADATDRLRPRSLVETLIQLSGAMSRGVRVLGYLHWSLLDNFEWADGYRGRFGLYAVDFADPARRRTRRRSADVFARITRANGVDTSLAAEVGLAL